MGSGLGEGESPGEVQDTPGDGPFSAEGSAMGFQPRRAHRRGWGFEPRATTSRCGSVRSVHHDGAPDEAQTASWERRPRQHEMPGARQRVVQLVRRLGEKCAGAIAVGAPLGCRPRLREGLGVLARGAEGGWPGAAPCGASSPGAQHRLAPAMAPPPWHLLANSQSALQVSPLGVKGAFGSLLGECAPGAFPPPGRRAKRRTGL